MDRYLTATEARRELLGLVDRLDGGDRVIITKRGKPCAVLMDADRHALLEDAAWVLSDPVRRAAMEVSWQELKSGELHSSRQTPPSTVVAAALAKTLARKKKARSRK